jgi:pilus assembly protein CpaB
MSLRTIASFAVAILFGLLAVILVRNYIGGQQAGGANAPSGTIPVVVATRAIPRGATLAPEMLKVVNFSADSVPQGAFQDVAQVVAANGPTRLALREMGVNEAVVASKISGPGSRPTLAGQLTPGMRAVSMRTSDVSGVAGFVLPGDRVDVLLTRTTGEGSSAQAQTLVQVLAENVLVLGVDQQAEADKPTVARAVTVEVTPDQAQIIPLAQAVGEVSLALRQSADGLPLSRRMTTLTDLGGARPRPAVAVRRQIARAPPPPPLPQVRVTRGTESAGYAVPF